MKSIKSQLEHLLNVKVYYLPLKQDRGFPMYTFVKLSWKTRLHNWILNLI
jgi:hypothetical protein